VVRHGTEQSWLTGSGLSRILRLTALVSGGVVVYFAVLAALASGREIFQNGRLAKNLGYPQSAVDLDFPDEIHAAAKSYFVTDW